MYKIIIISKASIGARGRSYGLDGMPFAKASTKLKSALEEQCKALNIPAEISVDNYTGDLKMLKRDGADLVLISPYVATAFLPLDTETEAFCLPLSENMFLSKNLAPIIDKIRSL